MKKYISIFVLCGLLVLPAITFAQVESTVKKIVVPKPAPILKKPTKQAVSSSKSAKIAVLKTGSKDVDAVRSLQAFLNNALGLNIPIDGVFGRGTQAAVLKFQEALKLPQDGVVGPQTALAISKMPKGIALPTLDQGAVKYLADSAKKDAKIAKTKIASLPLGVASVLQNSLPSAPVLVKIPTATNLNSQSVSTTADGVRILTRKPKASAVDLSRAEFFLASPDSIKSNIPIGSDLAQNYSSGVAGLATSKYICAEFDNDRDGHVDDQLCGAVSNEIAAAVAAGQISARDALIVALGLDGEGGSCSVCGSNGSGISVTGGGCSGGGPGSGEFITPPSTPVPGTPACIPKSEVASKEVTMTLTADNVFTTYFLTKNENGVENIAVKLKDMNWNTATDSNGDGINDFGWKSAETWSGLAPSDISAIVTLVDDDTAVASGFLGNIKINGKDYITGVSSDYEVAVSTVDGPEHPNDFPIAEALQQIKNAVWQPSEYIANHGDAPWGNIAGIPTNAKWLNLDGLYNSEKYLMYRLKVCDEEVPPTPTITDSCMDFRVSPDNLSTLGTGHYTVSFNEPVIVTGIPQLKVQKDASAPIVTALFTGYKDADHKVLEFTAQINAGPNAGIDSPYYVGTGTVNLVNGATIKNAAGQDATLTPVTYSATDLCPPSTEMCIDYSPGLGINYTVTFVGPITVTGNESDIKVKIVKANGEIIYGNYTGPSAGGNGMHFILNPGTPFTPSAADFVGTATLVLSNGATVKNAQGVPVNTYLGVFTADDKCTAAEYHGVATLESVLVKEVTQIAATGGYNNGPQKKLQIKLKFKSSQDGNPNAYVFGTPAIYLQKNETNDLGARATYVEGSGTTELTFEHVSNSQNYPDDKYDTAVYNHLKIDTSTGTIHTLANNGWSYWFSNLSWFDTH